jgi:hypothetical protein
MFTLDDFIRATVITAIFALGGGLIGIGNYLAAYAKSRSVQIVLVWPFYGLGGVCLCWALLLMVGNLIGPPVALLWEIGYLGLCATIVLREEHNSEALSRSHQIGAHVCARHWPILMETWSLLSAFDQSARQHTINTATPARAMASRCRVPCASCTDTYTHTRCRRRTHFACNRSTTGSGCWYRRCSAPSPWRIRPAEPAAPRSRRSAGRRRAIQRSLPGLPQA